MRFELHSTHSGPPGASFVTRMKSKTSPSHQRKSGREKPRRDLPSLNLPPPRGDVAGADIGAREILICVPASAAAEPVRTFATFTADLQAAVAWLQSCGVRSVAMESTGLYWLALGQLLAEAGMEVVLVNARHVRHLPGRKSDVLDCQWLQYLHSVGLLRGSFRPADELCRLRSLTRHRDSVLEAAASQVRHAQKALTQMNLQIHHVIDDLTGVTGTAIIEAILAGERDPATLARLRDPRVKVSREVIAKSLEGHWRSEHLLVLRLAWQTRLHYAAQIAELEKEIHARTAQIQRAAGAAEPTAPATPPTAPKKRAKAKNTPALADELRAHYCRIFGTDLTRIPSINILTVQALLSEVGPDLRAFPSARAWAAWAGLCPGTKITGGKTISRRSRHGKPRIARMLRQSALGLHASKSALGARYRRLRARLGAPKALTAMAHLLLRIIYKLVTTATDYDDSIYAALEANYQEHRLKRLRANAQSLGFILVPQNSPTDLQPLA
jgi:transposase